MNLKLLKNIKVLVIGDIMLDTYYKGSVKRISPEAPVPVVRVSSQFDTLGGAANVVRNLCMIGCNPFLIGCVGEDGKKEIILQKLEELNVENMLISTDYPTINKIRIIGNHQQIARIDFEEEKMILTSQQEDKINQIVSEKIPSMDCVIISDYGKGFCTKKICRNAIETANKYEKIVIIDPKGIDWEKYANAMIITPNMKELSDVLGKEINNENEEINTVSEQLLQKHNLKNILITRSEKGMSLIGRNIKEHMPTEAKEVFDVSGAGDTVVATLAACLAIKMPLKEAVLISNKAAGIVVSKEGTVPIYYEELMKLQERTGTIDKCLNQIELVDVLAELRRNNNKIVFTNGCFDIIHSGHVHYLQEAKNMGDILIVGLNSDSSVKRLKGSSRPINNEKDRAFVLSGFAFIDYIVIFEEDTPLKLIETVAPNILVKGGDYSVENVVGREYAKETRIINFVDGYSSSDTIKKMEKDK